MPFLRSSWALPWCPTVCASDASEDGFGICFGTWPVADVSLVGRIRGRGRFRKCLGPGAREAFRSANCIQLDEDGHWRGVDNAADIDDDNILLVQNDGFPEINASFLQQDLWRPVVSRPWRRKGETICVLEARVSLEA
jgi:hypothetical protein